MICTKQFATGTPLLSLLGGGGRGAKVGFETSDEASLQGTSRFLLFLLIMPLLKSGTTVRQSKKKK